MPTTSSNVVALANKITKPETQTVTRTVAVPETKIVKQESQQQTESKGVERADFPPIRPQPPLPHQKNEKGKRKNCTVCNCLTICFKFWLIAIVKRRPYTLPKNHCFTADVDKHAVQTHKKFLRLAHIK